MSPLAHVQCMHAVNVVHVHVPRLSMLKMLKILSLGRSLLRNV